MCPSRIFFSAHIIIQKYIFCCSWFYKMGSQYIHLSALAPPPGEGAVLSNKAKGGTGLHAEGGTAADTPPPCWAPPCSLGSCSRQGCSEHPEHTHPSLLAPDSSGLIPTFIQRRTASCVLRRVLSGVTQPGRVSSGSARCTGHRTACPLVHRTAPSSNSTARNEFLHFAESRLVALNPLPLRQRRPRVWLSKLSWGHWVDSTQMRRSRLLPLSQQSKDLGTAC